MNREELMQLDKEEIINILLAATAKIAEQTMEIANLKAQLNQNSKNSSKPPSSDGLKKPKSLRKSSGKKAGGQEGHEGSGFKLTQEPDECVSHEPEECLQCPKLSECQADKTINETRYEIDIVINTTTKAHQAIMVKCPETSEILIGSFPENITSTMQYGVNIEALAVSLNTVGMVSINRTHEILGGVFNVPISTGTISSMISNCAKKVASVVAEIKEAILSEPIIHVDETGTRVDKQTFWAHTASTEKLTYIDVEPSRGKKGMDAIGILPKYFGKVIHDCWASYFMFIAIIHGLCNAHLLRELTAVLENTKQAWSQKLIDLLLKMKEVKEEFLAQSRFEAPLELLSKYLQNYDEILSEALAQNPIPELEPGKKKKPKRGKTGALVDRLILRKDQYLLFFTDFSVPFDNNQAERDIRMFKIKQKVSGCFRTFDGARDFAAISSFVGTARKHGISGFSAIKNALLGRPISFYSKSATE
jgi:transposase